MLANPPELELAVVQLVRVFERAEADINARLNATSGPYTKRIRNQRRGEIRAILGALRELLNPNAGTEAGPLWQLVRVAYRTGSDRAIEGLRAAGVRDISTNLGGAHLDAARTLFESLATTLDGAIDYVGRRTDDLFRRAALEELVTSEISGRNRRDTSKAIEGNLKGRGVQAFRDQRGTEWSLSRYSEMAVRTTSREAHTTATLLRLTENGFDLVKISKSPTPCDECKRHEGKIYSITGTTEGYPQLIEAPPYHPQCSHAVLPVIEVLAA